jgi:Fe-S cluster assembly iron-binding protein IscA
MNITLTDDAADRLRALLENEGEDACIRIRETKIGAACKAKIVLVLSIDEREDDDVEEEVNALPFAINSDLVDQYGEEFAVSLDEKQIPVVVARS